MTQKIFKYVLPIVDRPLVRNWHNGARPLTVQFQNGQLALWAHVNDATDQGPHTFAIYGTGHPLPSNPGEYIGTVQDGLLVWHVFDLEPLV